MGRKKEESNRKDTKGKLLSKDKIGLSDGCADDLEIDLSKYSFDFSEFDGLGPRREKKVPMRKPNNCAIMIRVPKKRSEASPTDKVEYALHYDFYKLYGVRCLSKGHLVNGERFTVKGEGGEDYPMVLSSNGDYVSMGKVDNGSKLYAIYSYSSVYLQYEDDPAEYPGTCEAVLDEESWHYFDAIGSFQDKYEAVTTISRLTREQFDHVVHMVNRPPIDESEDDTHYVPVQDVKTLKHVFRMCYYTYPVQKRTLIEALIEELDNTPYGRDSYADIVTQLSYAITIDDRTVRNFGVKKSDEIKAIFRKRIYGMEDLIERVTEYIIAMQYSQKGNLLLLLDGPPGVGKTAVCQAIAEATNRKLVQVDCSGVDIVGLAGLVKSYGGAQPSKISKALYRAGTTGVVLMLEELDKLDKRGKDSGDVYSPLAKPLGPDRLFFDEFLGFDTSVENTIIVATCNDITRIPGYILNRFGGNILHFQAYSEEEKKVIARDYLVPKWFEHYHINAGELLFSEKVLDLLSKEYCPDAGARLMDSHIERIIKRTLVCWADEILPRPFTVDSHFVRELLSCPGKRIIGFA